MLNKPIIAITTILLVGGSSCASPVDRLSRIEGEELRKAVINEFEQRHFDVVYMLSSIGNPALKKDDLELLIKHYDHIENTLISLLDERRYAKRATELLMAFGGDEALSEIFRRVKDHVSPEDVIPKATIWVGLDSSRRWNNIFEYVICQSLASPSNDDQWEYVRQCPCAYVDCPLATSDDPRSLEFVEVSLEKELDRLNSLIKDKKEEPSKLSRTIKGYPVVTISEVSLTKQRLELTEKYFDSLITLKKENPMGFLASDDMDTAIINVFPIILHEDGDQYKAEYFIQYNNRGDIAWVNLDFETKAVYGYVLVFAKKDDSWSLKAVWHKPFYDNTPGPIYGPEYK